MNKDLTVGNPEKVLWQFCLPLFGSIIFQQLYNIADSLVAGKFIGENALAAVGNSYEITLIFIAFAFGCNMGCSVVVSKLFGAKDFKGMKTAVYTACIFSAFVCVCLMLIGILGSEALLKLIRTPDEVFADSKLYLDIYAWGLPFVFYYNIATGIFSALGDSKTPFYFLAASSTSNIAVDIWFVKGFNMGVAGVAWATFLCQGISCILAMVVIFRRLAKIEGKEKAPFFDKKILMQIVVIAVPSTLQQSFISLGNIVIQSIINGFGAPVFTVLLRRKHCLKALYGRAYRTGNAYRYHLLKDPFSVLLCSFCKAGSRWYLKRCRTDEELYGSNLYRPDPSCCTCLCIL